MVSNGFELLFWVVLMAIMFMLGSLIQQSKLDKANIKVVVLEHDYEKLKQSFEEEYTRYEEKIDNLHKEIDRLHRKYGD